MSIFTDALNRSIDIKAPPTRIVSLVPSLTETLFAFGLSDRIAGVTDHCVEPAHAVAGKPRIGGTKTFDTRRVLDLQPDLIIANAEENREEDIRRLLAAGQTIFVTFPRTVPQAIAMMRQIADITGTMDRARPIIEDAQQALNAAITANEKRQPLRTFCPVWRRPWMTAGPNTYVHDVLLTCGAINIFADRHDRYPKADLDEVSRRIPEVIILPSEPYPFREKHISDFTPYAHIPAVRDNRIYLVDGKHICWYGPRIGPSLRYIQGLLWEEEPRPAEPSP